MNYKAEEQVMAIANAMAEAGGVEPRPISNPGLFDRAVRNFTNAWRAVRGDSYSEQSRFSQKNLDAMMGIITSWSCQQKNGPPYGSMARDKWLHDFIFSENAEPILNGAVHTFTAKVQTLNWYVSGPSHLLGPVVDILENADEDGWTPFLGRWVNQYAVLDIGGLAEIGWLNDGTAGYDVPGGMYVLDGTRCRPTRNYDKPFIYYDPIDGHQVSFRKQSVMQLLSMPNPNALYRGLGLSPVSRALRTARLLDVLHTYEEERLSNLPPEGIATITGMTMSEVKTAMRLYGEKRESTNSLTFPGILWLVASKMPFGSTQRKIDVDLTPFSSLPEYFDKKSTVELFVKTLAITFGVDVAEFWQIESHGATKAQATLQAQKAKGKGIGLIVSLIERVINQWLMPRGVSFRFETADLDDDLFAAELLTKKIENVSSLYYGKAVPGDTSPRPLISWDEARYLMVKEGIIPREFSSEIGHEMLDPVTELRLYSHKLKGYLPVLETNPFPKDYEGMRHALQMLEGELVEEIGKRFTSR